MVATKHLTKKGKKISLHSREIFMNKRVYIETSVISGYGRRRFHSSLMKFFDLIRKGVFIPIISVHTLAELYDKKHPLRLFKI